MGLTLAKSATLAGWLLGWGLLTAAAGLAWGGLAVLISTGSVLLAVAGLRPLGLILWRGAYWVWREGRE